GRTLDLHKTSLKGIHRNREELCSTSRFQQCLALAPKPCVRARQQAALPCPIFLDSDLEQRKRLLVLFSCPRPFAECFMSSSVEERLGDRGRLPGQRVGLDGIEEEWRVRRIKHEQVDDPAACEGPQLVDPAASLAQDVFGKARVPVRCYTDNRSEDRGNGE